MQKIKTPISFLIFSLCLVLLGACERNPVARLVDPTQEGSVPQSSGIFDIYADELKTGGGVALIPGGENQSLDFRDRTGSRRTEHQIRYTWNGGNVSNVGVQQHLFAGFQIFVPETQAEIATHSGKDLSSPGYTKLTFWARGSLSQDTIVRIEGPSDGSSAASPARLELNSSQLGSDWQFHEFVVPTADFNPVNIYLVLTFQYTQPPRTSTPGGGGTIYLDDIRYER